MQGSKTYKAAGVKLLQTSTTQLAEPRRSPTMATPVATCKDQATTPQPTLFLAFELGVTT